MQPPPVSGCHICPGHASYYGGLRGIWQSQLAGDVSLARHSYLSTPPAPRSAVLYTPRYVPSPAETQATLEKQGCLCVVAYGRQATCYGKDQVPNSQLLLELLLEPNYSHNNKQFDARAFSIMINNNTSRLENQKNIV